MGHGFTKWVLLFVAAATAAMAGEIRVSGPVFGKWSSGDSIVVESASYVPEGETLEVDAGVSIYFEGVGRFEAYGQITMHGSAENPVRIHCTPGWRGIRLTGVGVVSLRHVFEYVNINSESGLARQAIEVQNTALIMRNCHIAAFAGCLRVTGSYLIAQDNTFFATGLYSRAVELIDLAGVPSDNCSGNLFRDNFIKTSVAPIRPGDNIDPFAMTVGLRVDYSTNICLSYNEIVVRAPLTAVGVWFVNSPTVGEQVWELDHSIIYSESTSRSAMGILNEVDGDLSVSRTTVTVQGTGGFISTCFYASRTAYILVNSTTTILGGPQDLFFNTSGTGEIDANYLVKWMIEGTSLDQDIDDKVVNSDIWELQSNAQIRQGDSVWTQNPMFHEGSVWGEWSSREAVHSFYTLTSISPCIDRGDPVRGYDPDNTRWDIGHDYYDQSTSPVDPDQPGVVSKSQMLAAYPNPFNPTTILPIEVSGRGILSVVIWDILGRQVMEQNLPIYQAGLQNVHFDASTLSSGTYMAQAVFDGVVLGSQRLVLMK